MVPNNGSIRPQELRYSKPTISYHLNRHAERMSVMRDFTWGYFSKTGDITAYLLYKDLEQLDSNNQEESDTDKSDGAATDL
jgi:hypothetical protein